MKYNEANQALDVLRYAGVPVVGKQISLTGGYSLRASGAADYLVGEHGYQYVRGKG